VPLKFSFSIFNSIPPAHGNTYTVTPVNYLFTQFSVIVQYIQLLLVPIGQNLEHDVPIAQSFFELRTLLSFLLLAALVGLAVYLFNKSRILAFGIFWFFITLAVESSFLPIEDLIFEHRTYLPAVGFFLFLTTGAYQLLRTNSQNLVVGILLLIAGANAVLTHQRNKVWKDDYTLLQDIISKSPNKARPHVNLGSLYMDRAQWDKALPYFSKAIEINPGFFDAYNNRAAAWFNMQQWINSIADYSKAIEIKPESAKPYYNRAIAYNNLGQVDKALADFNRSIELDAQNAPAYGKRGLLFDRANQLDKALADYSRAIELDPKYAEAFSNRGIAHGKLGLWQKSIDDFNRAIEIDPNLKAAYSNREISMQNLKNEQNK
jgi:tetratricopeptide (TPR) repeat protein